MDDLEGGDFENIWEMSPTTVWLMKAMYNNIKIAFEESKGRRSMKFQRKTVMHVVAWSEFRLEYEKHLREKHKSFLIEKLIGVKIPWQ